MNKINRNEAKAIIKGQEPTFLTPAKKQGTYICPNCNNGTGTTGDGIALDPNKPDKKYKCFKCDLYEDIIGLFKIKSNISNDKELFNELYKYYGLEVENDLQIDNKKINSTEIKQESKKEKKDFTNYLKKCSEQINKTDYPQSRGLSDEIIKKFRLGYDEHFTTYTGGKTEEWKALIIPITKHDFIVRNLDKNAPSDKRYQKRGTTRLYNKKALYEAKKPIFIVEGEIDALSIMTLGGEAVALSSTSSTRRLLGIIKEKKPVQPLILALDNDEAGKKATQEIIKGLEEMQVAYYEKSSIYGENKDANGLLLNDRENFKQFINDMEHTEDEVKNLQKEEYLKTSVANHLQDFINGINDNANTRYIPTGFEKLDNILDGGLYEGLYIVGAISSLGKTTLITQIADQIAEAGDDILIFSLEMARSEIMAKSISRETFLNALDNKSEGKKYYRKKEFCKTSRGITTGARYEKYSEEEKELIKNSIASYGAYASNIYIHEGIGNIGVQEIRDTVQKHINITGKKPVVIIDYLQILAPSEIRATDKQNTDKAVLELKRISRDYKLPVIGISSLNRANYKNEISMEAFKESGAIEYSSDVLIGLQFNNISEKFDVNEAKKKTPREIQLVILKNRSGATGDKINMKYYPLFNYFKED